MPSEKEIAVKSRSPLRRHRRLLAALAAAVLWCAAAARILFATPAATATDPAEREAEDEPVQTGHLREPKADLRPSGALLSIFDLPQAPAPVAPFTLARFVVPPGVTTSPDTHDVREVWVIVRGEGVLTLDGEETRVRAGDVLYYESRQTHQLVNDGDEPVELVTLWWRP